MEVDMANLDDGEHVDDDPVTSQADTRADASLPVPQSPYDAVSVRHVDDEALLVNNWALEHIENLEGQLRQLRESETALRSELRVLRGLHDEHIESIGRLNRDLLQYQGMDPRGMALYTTTSTGRTWHRNRDCHHIRNIRAVRQMQCCQDCGR